MTQESIIYNVPDHPGRRVTVVNGQPYYLSVSKQAWFPFIMVQGTCPLQWENVSKNYNEKNLKGVTLDLSWESRPHELLNICGGFVTTPDSLKLQGPYAGRIRDKQALLDTMRLGNRYDESITSRHLTTKDLEKAQQHSITFKEDAEELSDPDRVNQWLIDHGATVPNLVLNQIQEKKGLRKDSSDDELEKKTRPASRVENNPNIMNGGDETKHKSSNPVNIAPSPSLFSKPKIYSKKDNTKKIAAGIFFTLVPVVAGLIYDEITGQLGAVNFLKSPTPKLGDLPNGVTMLLGTVFFIAVIYYFCKRSQAKDIAEQGSAQRSVVNQ